MVHVESSSSRASRRGGDGRWQMMMEDVMQYDTITLDKDFSERSRARESCESLSGGNPEKVKGAVCASYNARMSRPSVARFSSQFTLSYVVHAPRLTRRRRRRCFPRSALMYQSTFIL